MGIRVEPTPDPFGDDCLTCYEPGQTPQFLYAVISGQETDDDWTDEMPAPPNGTYKMTQTLVNPCSWSYEEGIWHVAYSAVVQPPGGPGSRLSAIKEEIPPIVGFAGWRDTFCRKTFTGGRAAPGFRFYTGGSAWIFSKT